MSSASGVDGEEEDYLAGVGRQWKTRSRIGVWRRVVVAVFG